MRMFSPENVPMPEAMEAIEDLEMERDLLKLIVREAYTSSQIREAYYQVAGVSDKEPDPETAEIRDMMQSMYDNKFPLNRLAKIVNLKERSEQLIEKYHAYIDGLSVTDNEKRVLHSIVDKRRSGRIECRIDGVLEGEFDVVGAGQSKERLASEIINSIRYILRKVEPGQKYEFSFEEK